MGRYYSDKQCHCVILSVLVLGYVLNEFFQRYNKKEVLQQRYHDEYIKSLDSIKLENIKIVERLDNDIKQYLGKIMNV